MSSNGAIEIGRTRKEDALDVLCAAFHNYPVMRYTIGEEDPEYDSKLRELVGFFVESRLARDVPLLALEESGVLQSAAVVSPPDDGPMPPDLEAEYERVCAVLGTEAIARFDAYDEACDVTDPGVEGHYLGMLGTRPAAQGAGYGRAMIDAVKALAQEHGGSGGISLNTERESNLGFYRKLGFRVSKEADAGPLHTWSFVWRCEA